MDAENAGLPALSEGLTRSPQRPSVTPAVPARTATPPLGQEARPSGAARWRGACLTLQRLLYDGSSLTTGVAPAGAASSVALRNRAFRPVILLHT